MATSPDRRTHWDSAYAEHEHSWDQARPTVSLDLLEMAGVPPTASVVDIGGGDAHLVDALLDRGHRTICVLDVSQTAVDKARARLGDRGSSVGWTVADVTTWEPERTWQVWHDRAVFHFLTEADDREAYGRALVQGTAHGSVVVMATFAPDGPDSCSGLPVQRYEPDELVAALPPVFTAVVAQREVHTTPWGSEQPFTWVVLRRT